MTNKKPFVKWVLHRIEPPLHQNLIYWPFPNITLEQSLRAIWDAASQDAVFILPQIKVNLELVHVFSWHQDPLSSTVSSHLLKSMSTESLMLSNHLILCHSLLLLSIFPIIRVFSMSWLFTLGGQSIGASASATEHSYITFQLILFHLNLRLNASLACFRNITVNVSKEKSKLKTFTWHLFHLSKWHYH